MRQPAVVLPACRGCRGYDGTKWRSAAARTKLSVIANHHATSTNLRFHCTLLPRRRGLVILNGNLGSAPKRTVVSDRSWPTSARRFRLESTRSRQFSQQIHLFHFPLFSPTINFLKFFTVVEQEEVGSGTCHSKNHTSY